jgi:hypothetical protein
MPRPQRAKRGAGRQNGRATVVAVWSEDRRKNEEGFVRELWSGRVARLRAPNLETMLLEGVIPDPLAGLVQRMLYLGADAADYDNLSRLNKLHELPREELAHMLKLFEVVCKAMFIEPRIVNEVEGENEITIDDVDILDRVTCWQLALGGVRAARWAGSPGSVK